MKGFLLGIIVTVICLAVGVYIYFGFGFAPVAVSSQAMPFEKKLANMALHARQDKEAPKSAPFQPTEANYVEGAKQYTEHCAVCHGVPNQEQSPIGKGEFPKPPHLFKGKGVTDDPAGESYWKIANGIRMTGMPAFKGQLSDEKIWDLAFLVADAHKLPPAAMSALTAVPQLQVPQEAPVPKP